MKVLEGTSNHSDASMAVSEAVSLWDNRFTPEILFVFHSTRQDPSVVSSALAERFPKSLIVGATTAGEWVNGKHQHGSLALLAIASSDIRWAVEVADHLDQFNAEDCSRLCENLLGKLDVSFADLSPKRHFCLSFFDGLSKCEESVISMLSAELGDIPLLGGSAGDDLKFEKTFVLANGKALQNAALFVLAETKLPFKTIKHQHFIPGEVDTIITKADVAERVVYHLDGMPAAQRYAALLDLQVEELNAAVFSEHPLIYQHQRECYVRSISQVGENNSLIFYCAIEEGMILNLCSHQDMVQQLEYTLHESGELPEQPALMLVCNCILRRLEAESHNSIQDLARVLQHSSKHVFGFDTYGEQWQGLHINQTMVALALYDHE